MLINAKFKPFFKYPMLSGIKIYTARTRPLGKVGDQFEAFGALFEIVSVSKVKLKEVRARVSAGLLLEKFKVDHGIAGEKI